MAYSPIDEALKLIRERESEADNLERSCLRIMRTVSFDLEKDEEERVQDVSPGYLLLPREIMEELHEVLVSRGLTLPVQRRYQS